MRLALFECILIMMYSGFFVRRQIRVEYGALRSGSFPSYHSSNTSLDKNWTPAPKDLYSWMAEQHRPRKNTLNKEQAESIIVSIDDFSSKKISHFTYFHSNLFFGIPGNEANGDAKSAVVQSIRYAGFNTIT